MSGQIAPAGNNKINIERGAGLRRETRNKYLFQGCGMITSAYLVCFLFTALLCDAAAYLLCRSPTPLPLLSGRMLSSSIPLHTLLACASSRGCGAVPWP
eukprot:1145219-Pelagomonas_calceolata.AAC.5